MESKVCCKETEVECTKLMNDRDYLTDILASEKAITVNTATALTEASNQKLHDEILEIFNTVEQIQAATYELAWNNGWYTLEESPKTKIKEKATSLQKKLDEFSK